MRLIPYIRRSETPARVWPETSSLFEEFANGPFFSAAAKAGDRWLPAVDILEKEGNLILRAEVPGVSEKEIDLKLEGNILTLRGEETRGRGRAQQLPSHGKLLWILHALIHSPRQRGSGSHQSGL